MGRRHRLLEVKGGINCHQVPIWNSRQLKGLCDCPLKAWMSSPAVDWQQLRQCLPNVVLKISSFGCF